MEKTESQLDTIINDLEEIKQLLQKLLIIEGANAGLTRNTVRELTGIATQRVSDLWAKLKKKNED